MQSLSDASLSVLNTVLQWVAISSMALGLSAAVCSLFVSNEIGRRQEQAIAELQPKPLKDRILAFLDALDPWIVEQTKARENHTFERNLTHAQNTDYQKLCEEDQGGRYIIRGKPEIIIGGFGGELKYPAKFTITDELVR